MKLCKKCQILKPLTEFSQKNATGRKPSLQPRCKTCSAQATKEWHQKNLQTKRDRYLQNTYGISENEYLGMLLAQHNSCKICNKEFSDTWGPDSPVVDHCHTHGHVRGILCNECNRGLGYFRDNPEALRKAAEYLESN